MSEKLVPSPNLLEQYVLLAKNAKGAAAVKLIEQVLEANGVYVFGELLDNPNIKELHLGPHAKYLSLLNIFAYGTYADYKENAANLPELTPAQVQKLRHLTVVSLATKSKCIPYTTLLRELDLVNLRELEDLIIEVIYADVIHGKLDQKNGQLEIEYTIGRDIQPDDIGSICNVLQEWCDTCDVVLGNIEQQVTKANSNKESHNIHKIKLDEEVAKVKKALKSQDQDDQMNGSDIREIASQTDKVKKPSKTKGLRGSSKFWQKSST